MTSIFFFGVIAAIKTKPFDWGTEFRRFKEHFMRSGSTQVIQYKGRDIGRLRIERSEIVIYVGGIHLLPMFQSKGIGSAIFAGLIEESKVKNIPIRLWVYNENKDAFRLYARLGFIEEILTQEERIKIKIPDNVKQLVRMPAV